MKMKDVKKEIYIETLEEAIINVKIVINRLEKLERQNEISEKIIKRDKLKATLNLELALASYCVLLRKMHENHIIEYDDFIRNNINAIIHSNRFEYYKDRIVVYSQKGEKMIMLKYLISIGEDIVKGYN